MTKLQYEEKCIEVCLTNWAAKRCFCLANSKLSDFAFRTSLFFFVAKFGLMSVVASQTSVIGTGTPAKDSLKVRLSIEPGKHILLVWEVKILGKLLTI